MYSSLDFSVRFLVTLSWAVSRVRVGREVCAFTYMESVKFALFRSNHSVTERLKGKGAS